MEHSQAEYRADFALYGAAVVALAAFLLVAGPRVQRLEFVVFAGAGLASWTVIEKRRKRCHALHHHTIGQSGYYGVTSAFWQR